MDTPLRLNLAGALCLVPLLPLTLRLADLQVMEHKSLATRASGEFSRVTEEIIPRADILDRNGKILAQSLPVWACFIDKRMVGDPAALAAKLSRLLKMPESEILRKYRAAERLAWVKTRLDYEESLAVNQAHLEGVGVVSSEERFYPNGSLARGILGVVSKDGHGGAGIELSQDKRLSGKARKFQVFRDGSGQTVYKSADEDSAPPEPLRLTLDRNVQYYAEDALQEAAAKFKVQEGLVAVEDPESGEILALAAYPATPLKNPAVQDTYEPGSTFKLITAAAALEDGLVGETETFFCENGAYEIAPGVVIHDHEPQGALTLQGIIEQSSNIGAAKVVERVGAARLYRMSRAFGFSNKTGVALPGETAGEMKPLAQITKVGLATASYGYGIGVSPLQVLNAYSAIANGGMLWEPSIVMDGKSPVKVRRVASAGTIESLKRMLQGVVDKGTGTTAQIPGYAVAGKTGTAHRLNHETKKYEANGYNASFVGFLPADKPLWTILIVLQDPKGQYYGAQVAAPVFAKLGKELLALKGVPPGQPLPPRPPQTRLAAAARPGLP